MIVYRGLVPSQKSLKDNFAAWMDFGQHKYLIQDSI